MQNPKDTGTPQASEGTLDEVCKPLFLHIAIANMALSNRAAAGVEEPSGEPGAWSAFLDQQLHLRMPLLQAVMVPSKKFSGAVLLDRRRKNLSWVQPGWDPSVSIPLTLLSKEGKRNSWQNGRGSCQRVSLWLSKGVLPWKVAKWPPEPESCELW